MRNLQIQIKGPELLRASKLRRSRHHEVADEKADPRMYWEKQHVPTKEGARVSLNPLFLRLWCRNSLCA